MKTRSNEIALVIGGILLGATLAAPVAGATLTAQESMQRIYVDGKLAQMEAYSISGHNYCKLRDIGQAVGFAVDYDPATNTVQIRTSENTTAQTEEAYRVSFGGGYTAGAYAALREAMRSGSATVAASAEERAALMNAVAAIGSYPAYDASDDGDTVTVYAKHHPLTRKRRRYAAGSSAVLLVRVTATRQPPWRTMSATASPTTQTPRRRRGRCLPRTA